MNLSDQTIGVVVVAIITNVATYLVAMRKSNDDARSTERARADAMYTTMLAQNAATLAQTNRELDRVCAERDDLRERYDETVQLLWQSVHTAEYAANVAQKQAKVVSP